MVNQKDMAYRKYAFLHSIISGVNEVCMVNYEENHKCEGCFVELFLSHDKARLFSK